MTNQIAIAGSQDGALQIIADPSSFWFILLAHNISYFTLHSLFTVCRAWMAIHLNIFAHTYIGGVS